MPNRRLSLLLLVLVLFTSGGSPSAAQASPAGPGGFHSSPVMFIENLGQWDAGALFQVRGGSATLWLAEDALWITIVKRDDVKREEVSREDAKNVGLPAIFHPDHARPDAIDQARALLDRVGLAAKACVYPRQLSAGQQQRVVIARALFNQPEMLFADEPTCDLDEQTEHEIMDLFAQIHAGGGVTIALVTHTTQLVSYGTRAVRMAEGQVLSS